MRNWSLPSPSFALPNARSVSPSRSSCVADSTPLYTCLLNRDLHEPALTCLCRNEWLSHSPAFRPCSALGGRLRLIWPQDHRAEPVIQTLTLLPDKFVRLVVYTEVYCKTDSRPRISASQLRDSTAIRMPLRTPAYMRCCSTTRGGVEAE